MAFSNPVNANFIDPTQVPIGTIVDWYRFDSATPLPDGYVICDGSKVTDKQSPYFGKSVPNLTNKFVMGVQVDKLGETGGRATFDPSRIQSNTNDHHRVCYIRWVQMAAGTKPLKQPAWLINTQLQLIFPGMISETSVRRILVWLS